MKHIAVLLPSGPNRAGASWLAWMEEHFTMQTIHTSLVSRTLEQDGPDGPTTFHGVAVPELLKGVEWDDFIIASTYIDPDLLREAQLQRGLTRHRRERDQVVTSAA